MQEGRRVYGTDPGEDPAPEPDHDYVELVGGPLDGQLVDVTGWTTTERTEGAALITEVGMHGAGGRAWYGPSPAGGPRWYWEGDTA